MVRLERDWLTTKWKTWTSSVMRIVWTHVYYTTSVTLWTTDHQTGPVSSTLIQTLDPILLTSWTTISGFTVKSLQISSTEQQTDDKADLTHAASSAVMPKTHISIDLQNKLVFGSETDHTIYTHLVVVLVGATLFKKPKAPSFHILNLAWLFAK